MTAQRKRKIDYIIVHTSATAPNATSAGMRKYWSEGLGWNRPGYHYLIDQEGNVENLHPEEDISYGVAGFNSHAIHVCWIGGVTRDKRAIDNRSVLQKHALEKLVKQLMEKYPKAKIAGHHNFDNNGKKACPCFSVRRWAADIGIPEDRIRKDDPYGMAAFWEKA